MDAPEERMWLGYPVGEWVWGLIGGAAILVVGLWTDGWALWALGALAVVVGAVRLLCGFVIFLSDLIGGRL